MVTLNSLQGYDIADYGYQLGRAWGIGQKDKNNGVLLIVAPNEREVRIEVGYGLEGDLTDAVTRLIIENAILPRFRAGDMAGRHRARRRRHHPGALRRCGGVQGAGGAAAGRTSRAGRTGAAAVPHLPDHRRSDHHHSVDAAGAVRGGRAVGGWAAAPAPAGLGRRLVGGGSSGGGFSGGGGSFGGGGASGHW